MSKKWDDLIRLIRRQVEVCDAETDDATLLARFAEDRDEAAFELLLRRYGPMVYAVCRRALTTAADAEDAFQATFLALIRRASQVRRREAVAGWLHQAALHAATDILRQRQRQHNREVRAARPEAMPTPDTTGEELLTALDQEVAGLPDRYRQAIVLCRILNKPLAEAGVVLGLSVAAVWKRIRSGEELLRQRLVQRGLTVPATGMGLLLAAGSTSALSPEVLRSAMRSAASASTGALPATLATRLLPPGLSGWVAVTAIAIACGAVAFSFIGGKGPPQMGPPALPPVATVAAPVLPPLAPAVDAVLPPRPPAPSLTLAGRVLDDAGQPVPNVRLAVLARSWDQRGDGPGLRDKLLVEGTADRGGRFHLSSAEPIRGEGDQVWVVAVEPGGRKRSVLAVPLAAGRAPADLTLRMPAGDVSGRVVGPTGQPITGATVRVTRFGGAAFEPSRPEHHSLAVDVWPAPVVTDPDGRFTFPGLDPTVGLRIVAHHPTTGMTAMREVGSGGAKGREIELALGQTRALRGRVVAADTGRPLTQAQVTVTFDPGTTSTPPQSLVTLVGADGRYALSVPVAARWIVQVSPGDAGPYLRVHQPVEVPDGGEVVVADVALPRGLVATGRVTDDTGRPVTTAKVRFLPRPTTGAVVAVPNGGSVAVGNAALYSVDRDGRFRMVVPPVPGVLVLTDFGWDYVPVEVDAEVTGGTPLAAHAVVELTGEEPPAVAFRLERARTIRGRAVLPNGDPVADGLAWCYHLVAGRDMQTIRSVPIRDGRFEIPGCRAGRTYTVVVADRNFGHGAAARVACEAEPVTVRLEPTGAVNVAARTGMDTPVAGAPLSIEFALPPDEPTGGDDPADPQQKAVRWSALKGTSTGPEGHLGVKGLVPGARYRLGVRGPAGVGYSFATVLTGGSRDVVVVVPGSND